MAVVTVAFNDLDTWLQNQPANTTSTPYELNITGLDQSKLNHSGSIGTLGYILNQNNTKYVDLSATNIPISVTSLGQAFLDCASLVRPPVIPNSVTSMQDTFRNCTSLTNAPVLPENITSLGATFYGCSSLTTAPEIPFGVTIMNSTFNGCTALVNTSPIPSSVYSMASAFRNCTSLVDAPKILGNISNIIYAFYSCTNLKTFSIKNLSQELLPDYEYYQRVFGNCTKLNKFYSDTPYELKSWLTKIYNESTSYFPNNPNNCTFNLYSEVAEIPISNLENDLSVLSANTTATPYKIKITELTANDITSIRTALTSNGTKYVDLSDTTLPSTITSMSGSFYNCKTMIKAPIIPDSVNSMSGTFEECSNLTEFPKVPSGVLNLSGCFLNCTSLTKIEDLPRTISIADSAFSGCTSLAEWHQKNVITMYSYSHIFEDCTSLLNFYSDEPYELKSLLETIKNARADNFPNSISSCHFFLYSESVEFSIGYFNNELSTLDANTVSTAFKIKVTELTPADVESSAQGGSSGTLGSFLIANPTKYVDLSETVIPSVTDLTSTFENCTSLIGSPDLPSTVTVLDSTYKGCTNLAEAPAIPSAVTEMPNTFTGCLYIEYINRVPSGVTDLTECFKNCSSLEEIEEFDVPTSVLKTNAEDCFYGCSSLTTIGVRGVAPITEASEWHALRLNFGNDNVSGKVYDKNKNATTIPQTTIVKGTLKLPVKTDELWFPPNTLNDEQVDNIIKDVIDTKRTFFNKNVMSPKDKSFVLWKDEHSNFVSNIDFGGGGGGSGITVYNTEEELEEDLPTIPDDTIVATYGDGKNEFQDAPLGSVIPYLGNTDPADGKWLVCDGRDTTGTAIELETHYPSLFMFLGGTNVLPDLRNRTVMGANPSSQTNPAEGNISEVRDVQAAQLPTIIGEFDAQGYTTSETDAGIGAFALKSRGKIDSGSSDASNYPRMRSFDASFEEASTDHLGNNVYTADGETRPANVRCNWIIKAVSSIDTYNMPSSEIAEVESYVDTGLSVVNTKIENAESYSTTEQRTGGKWIDGKPIYRRVLTGTFASGTSLTIPFSYADNKIDKFISINVLAEDGGGFVNGYYESSSNKLNTYYSLASNYFEIRRGSTSPAVPLIYYLTIEYTKTTD